MLRSCFPCFPKPLLEVIMDQHSGLAERASITAHGGGPIRINGRRNAVTRLQYRKLRQAESRQMPQADLGSEGQLRVCYICVGHCFGSQAEFVSEWL